MQSWHREAREAGLARVVTIGTSLADAEQGLAIAARHPGYIFNSVGLDPFACHEVGDRFSQELTHLDTLLASKEAEINKV